MNRLKALIFDSHYDPYKGVIVYVRVIERNRLKLALRLRMMATDKDLKLLRLEHSSRRMTIVDELNVGDVGFIVAGLRMSEIHGSGIP